ncbi:MAG: ribonucleoside-triphosphate reductase [Dehalococcoidia bacterium]|nr:ribonucleoside-triphosphate reductase [Dehalococcoidia bacterium]
MALRDDLAACAKRIPADLKEKKGVYTLEFVVAERKAFLSKKKLTYSAKFRIDDDKKELRFTEMLKEASSGMSSGDSDMSPGFGFKKEKYKIGAGPREGSIEEQSTLFGKEYTYSFDFKTVRTCIEHAAVAAGYAFKYQVTSLGL